MLFQTGRFRLLSQVRLAGPRSASAVAKPAGTADQLPWFGAVPPARANAATHDLVLGNAALADAALQVVQACMPGRRMLVAGCDSVWFSDAFCTGQIADGQVTIAVGQEAGRRCRRDRGFRRRRLRPCRVCASGCRAQAAQGRR